MRDVIDVNTGQVKATRKPVIYRSVAIGSCIVVSAIDTTKRAGAMAHIMLPGRAPKFSEGKTRYTHDAIESLIKKMELRGTRKENIEVCLVGGGNVLKKKDDTVCQSNINSVKKTLREKAIRIRSCALGGTKRRAMFFDLKEGKITYTEGDGSEKLLWQRSKENVRHMAYMRVKDK